jgi:hypothetical protein
MPEVPITSYRYPLSQPSQKSLIAAAYVPAFVKPLTFPLGQTGAPSRPLDIERPPSDFKESGLQGYAAPVQLYNGKSVWATVTLESQPYQDQVFNERTKKYEVTTLPAQKLDLGTVLVDIQMTKTIITTPINGRNGTVKEYYSDGDYVVSLRGALVNPKGTNYPYDEFRALNDLLKAKVSLKVTSEFLGLFPIYNLAITDYTFPQEEGLSNTQLFQINALSDTPIELTRK